MTRITTAEAEKNLQMIVDGIGNAIEPIHISGEKNSAVLVSEESWRAIQETLYLTSIPGMRKSIQEGLQTSINNCQENLDW